MLLNLGGVAVQCLNMLNFFAAGVILGVADAPESIAEGGSPALAMLFLELYRNGFMIAQVFFGAWLLPLGYLVLRSGFLPRLLGIVLIVDGTRHARPVFLQQTVPAGVSDAGRRRCPSRASAPGMPLRPGPKRDSMTGPQSIGRLAIAGASAFWIVNLLISLTPVAADYRSALSIRYVPMLVEAALGGLLIVTCVNWAVLRFPDRIPGRTPKAQSLLLSLCAFIAVTALIEVPGKFLGSLPDPWRLLISSMSFNTLRVLALGIVIGRLGDRTRRQ